MKKKLQQTEGDKKETQDNIGYENTKKSNNQDDKEQARMQTTDTGHDEGPKEDKDDTVGLRSESGSKTQGKVSGNRKKD